MGKIERSTEVWGLIHRSEGLKEGYHEHIVREGCVPVLFRTRREAREYREQKYGYIRDREDLRRWPHKLMMPKVVRMQITALTYVRRGGRHAVPGE